MYITNLTKGSEIQNTRLLQGVASTYKNNSTSEIN